MADVPTGAPHRRRGMASREACMSVWMLLCGLVLMKALPRDLITIITSSTPDRNNCSSTKALAGRRHRRQVAGQGRQ